MMHVGEFKDLLLIDEQFVTHDTDMIKWKMSARDITEGDVENGADSD